MPTIALAGNPNVGKTVIFNELTGSRQHVGNWPGVTVEKKEGKFFYKNLEIVVIDLPGCYSLTPYSIDERIARDFIMEEKPDCVVNIVDATNLERNLYLTVQLLEAGANVVLALNMMDDAERKGIEIDVKKLSDILKVPVVPMVATKKKGLKDLKEAIYEEIRRHEKHRHMSVGYGRDVEKGIISLEEEIEEHKELKRYYRRYIAIKLLEGDKEIIKKLRDMGLESLITRSNEIRKDIEKRIKEDLETYLVDKRYEFIKDVISEVVVKGKKIWTFTDMLDHVLTHKAFGIPIFLVFMWAVFQFTFSVAAPFADAIDVFFGYLGDLARASISDPTLQSFVADGLIAGLGAPLVFIPNIFFLFFALSLLEDSGYLARAAFVMDRVMYKIGLSGKSIVPMLLGFGCNVPAIMATRTIEDRKDRLITILVNPLISCPARLPVYVLFAGAFFAGMEGSIVFSMYILGIALAIVMTLFLRKIFFKGKPSPLILEMPPYRLPTLKSSAIHMWERGSMFLKKAGTIIFLGVIIVWFLSTYPRGPESDINASYVAMLGHLLQPIFAPLGWDWKAAVALFFGFIAKEVVVGTFGTLYGVSGAEETSTSLRSALHASYTPLSAYAYMAFVLIYVPCLATIGVIKEETGSWKWTLFAVAYELILAYVVALLIVGIGHLVGL